MIVGDPTCGYDGRDDIQYLSVVGKDMVSFLSIKHLLNFNTPVHFFFLWLPCCLLYEMLFQCQNLLATYSVD